VPRDRLEPRKVGVLVQRVDLVVEALDELDEGLLLLLHVGLERVGLLVKGLSVGVDLVVHHLRRTEHAPPHLVRALGEVVKELVEHRKVGHRRVDRRLVLADHGRDLREVVAARRDLFDVVAWHVQLVRDIVEDIARVGGELVGLGRDELD